MVITSIKPQQKRAGFFSISIDGKYAFSLSENGLLSLGLKIGQVIEKDEFKNIKSEASMDRLYNKALFYISFRPRSQWEIETYLAKNDNTNKLKDKILNKLSEHGFIDDEKFAQFWIQNRMQTKPSSKRKLTYELRAKRVNPEIINKALEDSEFTDPDTLAQVIERKRRLPRYQDKIKLMQYLSRQGYSYDDIKKALASS